MSIELIIKKKTCSICNKSPFNPECNHIAGDLYWGEMAVIVAEEVEALGVAIVKKPMDKRCVIYINFDKDNLETSPFKLIHFFIQNSEYPLRDFDMMLTKRKLPRKFYNDMSKESFCPCCSGRKFKECCFNKRFILNPHYNIIFKQAIPIKF